jgi:hypothetical protein
MSSDVFGWQNEYLSMLHDCELRDNLLDDWELEFVGSLRRKFDRPGFAPSPRQVETLDRIWHRVTA